MLFDCILWCCLHQNDATSFDVVDAQAPALLNDLCGDIGSTDWSAIMTRVNNRLQQFHLANVSQEKRQWRIDVLDTLIYNVIHNTTTVDMSPWRRLMGGMVGDDVELPVNIDDAMAMIKSGKLLLLSAYSVVCPIGELRPALRSALYDHFGRHLGTDHGIVAALTSPAWRHMISYMHENDTLYDGIKPTPGRSKAPDRMLFEDRRAILGPVYHASSCIWNLNANSNVNPSLRKTVISILSKALMSRQPGTELSQLVPYTAELIKALITTPDISPESIISLWNDIWPKFWNFQIAIDNNIQVSVFLPDDDVCPHEMNDKMLEIAMGDIISVFCSIR